MRDEKRFQRLIRKPETIGQLAKFVGKWEGSIKISYICGGCVLEFVKVCVYGKERGTA